jgi:hypothetical protein
MEVGTKVVISHCAQLGITGTHISGSDITKDGTTIFRNPVFSAYGRLFFEGASGSPTVANYFEITLSVVSADIYPNNLESLARCNPLHDQNALEGVSVRAQLDF